MRPETRFVGNGNAWIGNGHYRGWRITCSRCAAEKIVTSHHGSSLPPEAIVKTLVKSGWHIGRGPEEDLCLGCRKRKPMATKPVAIETSSPAAFFEQLRYTVLAAKRQLDAKQYFFVANNIDAALRSLDPAITAAVIAAMTPKVEAKVEPKPEPKPIAAKPEPKSDSDDDYQKWLAQLDSKETEA